MPECECGTGEVAFVHDGGCVVLTPEYQERVRARVAAQQEACARIGHPYDTEIGVGFGNVDYFCKGCGKIVRTVPVAELEGADAVRVGALVTDALDMLGEAADEDGAGYP